MIFKFSLIDLFNHTESINSVFYIVHHSSHTHTYINIIIIDTIQKCRKKLKKNRALKICFAVKMDRVFMSRYIVMVLLIVRLI